MIKPIDLAFREDFGCMFGSKYTNINDHNSCYLTVVNKSRFVTVTVTVTVLLLLFQVLCSNNSNFKPNLGVFNLSGGGL